MTDDLWEVWLRDWVSVLEGIARLGAPAFASQLQIAPPASASELAQLESEGIRLPRSMLEIVHRSARVTFHWRLFDLEGSDAVIKSPELGASTPEWGGHHAADVNGFLWDVAALPQLKRTYEDWLDVYFLPWIQEDPSDPYPQAWIDKLPIIEAADGDMIAIDLGPGPSFGQVVFLCHDDGCSIHGATLGTDFADFVTRWSRVGCVGPDGSDLEVFFGGGEFAGATSRHVAEWRSWIGMADDVISGS